jgi:hypothetical protein
MRIALHAAAAALITGALAQPTRADMTVYYHVGSWDAFSGPAIDGRMVCGVGSTNPGDNRSFSLRFTIGGDTVLVQAKKPSWTIPAGTYLPVVVQVGLGTPWTFQGAGDGQVVAWSLDRQAIRTFDAQFRLANSMTVSFPSGSEPPWTIGLKGSTAISNAFGRCVTDLTERAQSQPSAGTAAPTQPYSPAAPQPTNPQPAQR